MSSITLEKIVAIEQPNLRGSGNLGVPNYAAGSVRSQGRLRYLDFDPIGKLVERYRELEKDIVNYRLIRDGQRVELKGDGKPRAFSYDVLLQMEDRLISIGDKLLRYGYGRVPEVVTPETNKPPPMVVNLTRKGDVFVLNGNDAEFEDLPMDRNGDVLVDKF